MFELVVSGGLRQWQADNSGCLAQGDAAACTLSGLRAGCIYRVRVRARNDSGYSPYSQPADVGTAADVPGQPSAPAAISRTAHTVAVTWEPPAHDGGSPVVSYRLELCRGAFRGRVLKCSARTCKNFWLLVWLHICLATMQRTVLLFRSGHDIESCHEPQSDRRLLAPSGSNGGVELWGKQRQAEVGGGVFTRAAGGWWPGMSCGH